MPSGALVLAWIIGGYRKSILINQKTPASVISSSSVFRLDTIFHRGNNMSILKYRTALGRALMGISTLALLSLLSLLSAGCNQDGVGIFYSISQEEKQITSKISEVSVYQVVEANSNTMYALGGLTVWEQTGSNWNSLGGGFAYNIVEDTDTLYAYFNNDDENLAEGRIESYNGTTWTLEDNFSDDGKIMDIGNDTFALKLSGGTLHINSDLAVISGTSVGTVSIVGGTNLVNA